MGQQQQLTQRQVAACCSQDACCQQCCRDDCSSAAQSAAEDAFANGYCTHEGRQHHAADTASLRQRVWLAGQARCAAAAVSDSCMGCPCTMEHDSVLEQVVQCDVGAAPPLTTAAAAIHMLTAGTAVLKPSPNKRACITLSLLCNRYCWSGCTPLSMKVALQQQQQQPQQLAQQQQASTSNRLVRSVLTVLSASQHHSQQDADQAAVLQPGCGP